MEVVFEAIETCPVDCIHYVPWEDLIALESARDSPDAPSINFKSRLVGGTGNAWIGGARDKYGNLQEHVVMPEIKGNTGMRCE